MIQKTKSEHSTNYLDIHVCILTITTLQNFQSWLESMNYQRKKEIIFERKAESVRLFLIFQQSENTIERTEVQ